LAGENQSKIILKNPIRFDQLAVGQKSTYVLLEPDNCNRPSCCQQSLDTLQVEIIEQDTNGYLVKQTTTLPNSEPLFFYLKQVNHRILKDTIAHEPAIKEYHEVLAITTESIDGEEKHPWLSLHNLLGGRLYLQTFPDKSFFPIEIENPCEPFFLPDMKNDLLPFENGFHSELGINEAYWYQDNYYGDLFIMNHDYGYDVDGANFTYGYSLEAGLVFAGIFSSRNRTSVVWHLVSDN